jgi:mutator protein MutT
MHTPDESRKQPQTSASSDAPTTPTVDAAIAIVVRRAALPSGATLVLVCQRKDDDALGGYWEFPGGKCEDGETMEQCLARELREEIDVVATPLRRLPPIVHAYPDVTVRLHPFVCRHARGEPRLLECQAARWIEPAALRSYRFPPANEQLIEDVIALLSTSAGGGAVDFTAAVD